MDAIETSKVIELAGGDLEFARLLGLDQIPGFPQRVNNWKRRGMPSAVILDHYEVIRALRQRAASEREQGQAA